MGHGNQDAGIENSFFANVQWEPLPWSARSFRLSAGGHNVPVIESIIEGFARKAMECLRAFAIAFSPVVKNVA